MRWGRYNLHTIAKRLGRSEYSVSEKAKSLKLPAGRVDAVTLNEFMRKTGYPACRIHTAVEDLGLLLHPVARTDPRQMRRNRGRNQGRLQGALAITEDQQEAILSYLTKLPDGMRLYRSEGQRTKRGVWGIGIKPAGCLGCSCVDRPHYAKGLCKVCYLRPMKRRWERKHREGEPAGVQAPV